jgi:acyl-CoA thioester hydrolase
MTSIDNFVPGSGRREGTTHKFRIRVYYEDTDAGGIVYHANYLNYAERARTEMLRLCGTEQDVMRREDGVGFAVRRCEIDYRASARLDDVLEVRTVLRNLRGARVSALQRIHKVTDEIVAEDWMTRLDIVLACVSQNGRPTRLPERVRAAFARVTETD